MAFRGNCKESSEETGWVPSDQNSKVFHSKNIQNLSDFKQESQLGANPSDSQVLGITDGFVYFTEN